MKVYIASMFSDKDRVLARGKELAELGIQCTSRWATEAVPPNTTLKDCTEGYLRETAVADLEDITSADKVVFIVPEPQLLVDATVASSSRGGRHFESGFVYGLILAQVRDGGRPTRELIILGKRENVFHYLDGRDLACHYPAIRVIETWDEVKRYLRLVNPQVAYDKGMSGLAESSLN
jgi:hypothetical protein